MKAFSPTLKIVACVIVHLSKSTTSVQPYSNATDLHQTLLTNYNTDVRPIQDQSQPIYVNVSLFLVSIDDFDEVSGTLTIVAILGETWLDEVLQWNPMEYSMLSRIVLTQKKIWLPELYNTKAADEFKPISYDKFKVNIFYNGLVNWNPGGILKIKCSPDISMFSFDVQTCQIWLLPWGYLSSDVYLFSPSDRMDMSYYESNGEWSVLNTTASHFINDFSFVVFEIRIKRLPIYHIVNTILPIILLILLNPLVFILPCDSGERSGYGLTMLLSFTVFMTVVNDALPPTSDPMSVLSYIVFGTMVLSSVISAVNIFELSLYHKDASKPIPSCLGTLVQCLSCSKRRKSKIEPEGGDGMGITEKDVDYTWQDLVKDLDCILAVFFYVLIAIFFVFSVVYIAVNSKK